MTTQHEPFNDLYFRTKLIIAQQYLIKSIAIMKTQLLVYVLLFLITGCSQSTNKKNPISENEINIPVIDIDSGLKNISDIPFKCSEFIDSIIYIPLETKKESLLGGLRGVPLFATPKYVYGDLKKFDLKDGKFIFSVGKKGRGPGEFTLAIGTSTDIADDRVFVLDNFTRQILIYDNHNNFIKKVEVTAEIRGVSYLGDDNLILFRDATSPLSSNINPFEYQIMNLKDDRIIYTREIKNLIEQLKNRSTEKFRSYGIGRNSSWYFENVLQYYESFTDTIFKIESSGERMPRFYVKRKDYKPPLSEITDNESFSKNRSKYIEITHCFETPRFVFLYCTKGLAEGAYLVRFDKVKLETKIVPLIGAIENDLSLIKIGYLDNVQGTTYGIEYLDSKKWIDEFFSELENIPIPERTKSAMKLYDLLKKANLEDNGIIALYNFKK